MSKNDSKILLSWIASNNDFDKGEVKTSGPTWQFHQYFFTHDRHIILSSKPDEDIRLEKLLNRLMLDFPDRRDKIEGRYMNIPDNDVINVFALKPKVEALLLELSATAKQIDVFISPGTPAMQVVWYLCQSGLGLPMRLLQTREAKFTQNNLPELIAVEAEQSTIPISVVVRQQLNDSPEQESDYLITDALSPVYSRAKRISETERVTCLIQGASGTGKEHLARYIHQQSNRVKRPFIAVNCSALGDSLLESRLFGHEKGAFTGAEKATEGFFDAAKGGTLFLDEIGDISPYMQQTLLRVLQEQEFTPVGATKPRKADVRIVAATHKPLRQACQNGQFRWDLFYRLSVAELYLPPLSERGLPDKQALIKHFVKAKQKAFRKPNPLKFTTAAKKLLDMYLFPGNVRELENLIESLYVFTDGTVDVADLPDWLQHPDSPESSFKWEFHEKELIRRALQYFNGNKSKAKEALGYGSINTLMDRIKEYKI
ncbi:hypothetical protein GCM10023189_39140 [Nibrella saemangeumensis]|uniref:Sigma-54 factor interaction domain-containing protein n=1 Tax=Nibrella saemangeumensis TaxID=1084526 RepID=A0ABP8NBC9_9BACT